MLPGGIYTADGYVSVNLLPQDRHWKVASASLQELRQTVGESSSTGYAGRYEIDAAASKVTHIPMVSLDPADEGQRLTRTYALEGDTLKLSGTWTFNGQKLRFSTFWTRAK